MHLPLGLLIALIVGVLAVTTTVTILLVRRRALPPPPKPESLAPPAAAPSPPALEPPPPEAAQPAEPLAPPPPLAPLLPPTPLGPVPVEKPQTVIPTILRAEKRAELRSGLAKTRGGFINKLGKLFSGKTKIDQDTLARVEEVLFTADIGVRTSQRLIEHLRTELSREELKDPESVWGLIKDESSKLLHIDAPPLDVGRGKPFVILIIGVNGVGKTTTIGKLAAQFVQQGKRVLLAAGDTFRAAATEQLEVWGQRTGCPVVRGKEGTDPSSVIFEGVRRGALEGYDIVIADTAGRLHTKTNLMEELQKVGRVCAKASAGSPHETFLVLDATNGQNAIQQALLFKQAMDVTAIILTKLDGTAKGGVILGICDELKLPVRFIGIGERVEDLRPFDPDEFVEALYDRAGVEEAA